MTESASSSDGSVDVSLWFLPTDSAVRRAFCHDNIGILSREERAAVMEAGRRTLAERRLNSRVLLRLALASHIGRAPDSLRFKRQSSGRLALIGEATALSFNLSHAGEESVIAVASNGKVGVDIEPVKRAHAALRIARAFFPAEEYAEIEVAPDPGLRALAHWTLKESVVKVLEETVWSALAGIQFEISENAIQTFLSLSKKGSSEGWYLASGCYPPNHILSVALNFPKNPCCPISFSRRTLGSVQETREPSFPTLQWAGILQAR